MVEPDAAQFGEVADELGLHPLARDYAELDHHRPKLQHLDDTVFMVLKTLWYVDAEDAVETGEIALFAGTDFIVTVRRGQGNDLRTASKGLQTHSDTLHHGPPGILYAVIDQTVDAYLDVIDQLVIDVDEIETSVFSADRTNDSARIYVLKRELAEVRRAVLPLRDPLARLAGGDVPPVPEQAQPFFRVVGDHLARAADTVDSLDALLSTAFDAHLAQISVRQNDDMRKISAWVGLAAPPTVIGAIYGMNFQKMPELDWTFGYPFALVLMFSISGCLWLLFKRSGWL
jgi:magnesium transporter